MISRRAAGMSMKDFPHTNGVVSLHTKMLVHRDEVWVPFTPTVYMKGLLSCVRWIESTHEREAGRTADSLLAVGAIELGA